jgi:hypothetical protein
MGANRIGRAIFAILIGLGVWQVGPGLRISSQSAFAQTPIQDFSPGSYHVSYFDVSSSFTKSQQGYGGPGHSGGDGDALVRIVDFGN